MKPFYSVEGMQSYWVTLGKDKKRYLLQVYEDRVQYESLINLLQFNKKLGIWQCHYCEYLPYTGIKIYNQMWDAAGGDVVVLYSEPTGSGGFISYEVIGEEQGKPVKLVSEEMIFGGSVFFIGNRLIRGSGNQFQVWEFKDEKFQLAPYQMPAYTGAHIIRYSILDENTVTTEKNRYQIPSNGIIQFIREDTNAISERLMVESNCLEFIQIATYRITCPSTTTATIIPDAYHWDYAKKIEIITV